MPLPVTRREFDRLGDRLVALGSPSDTDLADLYRALAAYAHVLEQVKVHLRDLGFAPTIRLKTTQTIREKLRRTPGMDLSRMQDLAGARITVQNLAAQDEAKGKISEFYTAQGCRWREIDRRKEPSFGYRAMHLVVFVDELPVEIQIRTELQDSWAQIVESLGGRWGRGIRYGQDPENPEGIVRSGEDVLTRREILVTLMTLSDTMWSVEQNRRALDESKQLLPLMDSLWQELQSGAWPELLAGKIPPDLISAQETLARDLAARSEELDAEARGLLTIPAADLTNAQLRRMLEIHLGFLRRDNSRLTAAVVSAERRQRDILQLMAAATYEGT
jgi:ppGpp synthetase/RelA/SpoT-type nucleotidyltranferase